jgi:hypothetical protein
MGRRWERRGRRWERQREKVGETAGEGGRDSGRRWERHWERLGGEEMLINKTVIIVLLLGLIGLTIIFICDPTRNLSASSKIQVTINPGENYTLTIPSYSTFQFMIALLTQPYYWVETTMAGLVLMGMNETEMVERARVLIPAEIRGLLPVDDTGHLCIFNPTNESITSLLTGTRAPDPNAVSDYKGWWYMVFGVFEMVIASIVACIKPAPTVNVRKAADGSIGTLTGTLKGEGMCGKVRTVVANFLAALCIRRSTTGMGNVAL